MSGNNNPPYPPAPSIREAATGLMAALSSLSMPGPVVAEAMRRMERALNEPDASRPGALPDIALAMGSIGAMKRGEPIEPEGIRAIVELAEEGERQLAQFDVRWAADMRAIKRWQEANPGNDLVWPDHADLVVWLIDVIDRSVGVPSIDDVGAIRHRLGQAIVASGGNPLAKDARRMLDQLAEALRASERQRYLADERTRQAERTIEAISADMLAGLELLGEATEEIRGAASHYADHPDGMGSAYRAASDLARRIEAFVEPQKARLPAVVIPARKPEPVPGVYSIDQGEGAIDRERWSVQGDGIKAGHAVRADIDGQRYEGIASEDGRAVLKLVGDAPIS